MNHLPQLFNNPHAMAEIAGSEDYPEIKGKVHCFFEQSGTFKNEFIKLGRPAEDYDIQNNSGHTDNVVDLFAEIENAYEGRKSVFDNINKDDLIIAFFPCIYFQNTQMLYFSLESKNNKQITTSTTCL